MPKSKFYMTRPSLDARIPRGSITAIDWTPTLYYYGTVCLCIAVPEADREELGLYPYDDDAADNQAELDALYRAETRGA